MQHSVEYIQKLFSSCIFAHLFTYMVSNFEALIGRVATSVWGLSPVFLVFTYSQELSSGSDKAYFVDLFVRASNTPAIKMYEKVIFLVLLWGLPHQSDVGALHGFGV